MHGGTSMTLVCLIAIPQQYLQIINNQMNIGTHTNQCVGGR